MIVIDCYYVVLLYPGGGFVSPSFQIIYTNTTAKIYCESTTKPTWRKGTQQVTTYLGNFIFNKKGRELVLIDAKQIIHHGIYECRGTNKFKKTFRATSIVYVGGILFLQ